MLVRAIKDWVAGLAARSSASSASKVATSNDGLHALLLRAGELHDVGDLDAARALYQQVLQRDGEKQHALYRLGVIAAHSNDYADARTLLEKAITSDPH